MLTIHDFFASLKEERAARRAYSEALDVYTSVAEWKRKEAAGTKRHNIAVALGAQASL